VGYRAQLNGCRARKNASAGLKEMDDNMGVIIARRVGMQ